MKRRDRIVGVITGTLLASVLLGAGTGVANAEPRVPQMVPPPSSGPCDVNEHGTLGKWMLSYKAYFTTNACHTPVRAEVKCNNEFTTGSEQHYGTTITTTGWSSYQCDITQTMVGWGYQEKWDGKWYTFELS
jgi:hypothetical protein